MGYAKPPEGKKALDLMEVQIREYGVKAFEFYNVRYNYGEPFPWHGRPEERLPGLREDDGAPDRPDQGP